MYSVGPAARCALTDTEEVSGASDGETEALEFGAILGWCHLIMPQAAPDRAIDTPAHSY